MYCTIVLLFHMLIYVIYYMTYGMCKVGADFRQKRVEIHYIHYTAQDSKQKCFLHGQYCIICIIEWNHVYTLEILNILCDPRYSSLHLHSSTLQNTILHSQHYNTTVKYVHFTMFYTGDGNDLIYPRCVSFWLKIHGFLGTVQLGAFIYNYINIASPAMVKLFAGYAIPNRRFVSISSEN